MTYVYDLDLQLILSHQHFGFNPISSEVKRLGLSTFIFYFLIVVSEHINLVLLGSIEVYQTYTTNQSYRISADSTGAYTTSYYLVPKSHLEIC